jgi:hypothetical protein
MGKGRTPRCTDRIQNLHMYEPDPWDGSGPPSARSRDSGTKSTQALIKAKWGTGADTCSDHTTYTSAPRSGGGPMLPRGISPVT